jgi:hypothetical protein
MSIPLLVFNMGSNTAPYRNLMSYHLQPRSTPGEEFSPREEFSLIARAGSQPVDRRQARLPISEHRLRARLRSAKSFHLVKSFR